jgi:Ankyrin repeats (3 copies)/Ankyrin repeat
MPEQNEEPEGSIMRRDSLVSAYLIVALIALGAVGGGCSDPEREDWKAAQDGRTIEAYEGYLTRHPDGPNAAAARVALREMTEWRDAREATTAAPLVEFLRAHPDSQHAPAARGRLLDISWAGTTEANTVESYEAFLASWPDSPQASEAVERLTALQDDATWKRTTEAGTIESVESYLDAFADGAHAGEARERLAELRPIKAWWQSCAAHTKESYAKFVEDYPGHLRAAEARFRAQIVAREPGLVDHRSHPATFKSVSESKLVLEVRGPFEMGGMLLPEGAAMTAEETVESAGGIQVAFLDGVPAPGATVIMFGGLRGMAMMGKISYMWGTLGLAPPGRIVPSTLHEAAATGNAATVRALLDRGMPVDLRDVLGATPLHLAAARPDGSDVLRLLLNRGAEVDAVDHGGDTPFYRAIRAGVLKSAGILGQAGASPNAIRPDGIGPLHLAAAKESPVFTSIVLNRRDVDVNAVRIDGVTPLLIAAAAGNYHIVEALLEAKADPNPKASFLLSPLKASRRHADKRIMNALIAAGAK